jgi:Peptidase family M48
LRLLIQSGLLLTILANVSMGQAVNSPSEKMLDGIPRGEVSRRIFEGEQDTMRSLKIYSPIVETYIQSLWPDTGKQIPLDDIYFLSKVSISRHLFVAGDEEGRLFGRSDESWRLLDDNGQRQELYPAGFIHMLFIDPENFDPDTYRLTYLQSATLGSINCLVFAVAPVKTDAPGRFKGRVWVEKKGLRIVRVQGKFQVEPVKLAQRFNPLRSTAEFSISFDCWRQIIAPGLWAPAYVAIDDNLSWKAIGGDGTTDLHYRGHIFVWGYSYLGSFQGQHPQWADAAEDFDQVVEGLERDALVGPPGDVEQSLDGIVEEIAESNHLHLPQIRCRVLLTTPIEMFHVGNTIIVSRGLLEMVPDKDTLAVFLAHELAHILQDGSAGVPVEYTRSLFEYDGTGDFPGLVAVRSSDERETAAAIETCKLLGDSPYLTSMDRASAFVSRLVAQAAQVPNLTRARLGTGFVEGEHSVHNLQSCSSAGRPISPAPHLQLVGRYTVDAWTSRLRPVR